ncbi:calcineurin-like phosphoesterase C-terminal domain-containing protein [Mesonia sp. HuA40]|uniref:calcineurin-like phosphoesterase C-terminal domain-containing protein n=1 Tax=Mesonia sp. HuA40 TaxID=2602761 RepID=UPI0011C7DAB8|nr:calcineurin-like phosphoesterase C-terminal domain-containing protein [Mesonia sp. HuA40]TXK73370.1 TonB-dependent receptor plug domain-containing protein [Mesonia sp. HuA40]
MKTKLQKLIKLPYLFLGLCLLLPGINTFNSLAAEKSVSAIDLAIRNKTRIEIFETIESQTAYNFIYDTKITQDAAKYNINISHMDIQSVLKQLENLIPYTFHLYQHSISVKYQEQQQLILKGNVRDSQNIPLPGASVLIKSSGVGTTTDFDGNFSLEVSNFPVEIQISYMGFETQLIKLETNRVLEVTLQESDNALSKVVITALGIKREEKKLGYAQQSISNESLTAARPNNWSEALRGKVPGLNINGLGGPVGSQQIVLRGNASLDPSNNAALIVIDGVPISTMRDGTPKGYAYIHFDANQYRIQYKVAEQPISYQIELYHPKVVAQANKTHAGLFANFFMGSKTDLVEYRVDSGKWKTMRFTPTLDPSYQLNLFKRDYANQLMPGKRGSNAIPSTHLWYAKLPAELTIGKHQIEVRATDRYGQVHYAQSVYNIETPQNNDYE